MPEPVDVLTCDETALFAAIAGIAWRLGILDTEGWGESLGKYLDPKLFPPGSPEEARANLVNNRLVHLELFRKIVCRVIAAQEAMLAELRRLDDPDTGESDL
jgi:hypothetical protein